MQRKEKEITSQEAIEAVIKKARVCRIGLSDGENPYVLPVCFGYKDMVLYFHSALSGKKMDILKKNPRVCLEFDINASILTASEACKWSMRYQSIIGHGQAVFLNKLEDKRKAFDIIMRQYSNDDFHFNATELEKTAVIKINIESLTGKQSGF